MTVVEDFDGLNPCSNGILKYLKEQETVSGLATS